MSSTSQRGAYEFAAGKVQIGACSEVMSLDQVVSERTFLTDLLRGVTAPADVKTPTLDTSPSLAKGGPFVFVAEPPPFSLNEGRLVCLPAPGEDEEWTVARADTFATHGLRHLDTQQTHNYLQLRGVWLAQNANAPKDARWLLPQLVALGSLDPGQYFALVRNPLLPPASWSPIATLMQSLTVEEAGALSEDFKHVCSALYPVGKRLQISSAEHPTLLVRGKKGPLMVLPSRGMEIVFLAAAEKLTAQ